MVEPCGAWVGKLAVGSDHTLTPACSASTLEEFGKRLGPATADWGVHTARFICERVMDELGGFDDDPARTALLLGIEGAVLGILASVGDGESFDPASTPEALQSSREFVHRGVPLTSVWSSVRLSHRYLFEILTDACCEAVPSARYAVEFRHLSRMCFGYVDTLIELLGHEYSTESERWHISAAAVRQETINNVLADVPIDLATASKTLGYELHGRHHLGVVIWLRSPGAVDLRKLQDTALSWLTASGAQQTLISPQGESRLWAWGGRTSPFPRSDGPAQVESATGIRVAVGRTHRDISGFRRSHLDAQQAYRVARTLRHVDDDVVQFSSIDLLAMLSQDEDLANNFVRSELGGLAGSDGNSRELRRTLRAYLETHSPQTTASKMFVARNTITYRLRRAEELRGLPLQQRQLELWVALVLADAIGD